jgi:hypothetical protein
MMTQIIETPYGVLEVSPYIIPGRPEEYPVGTFRVKHPDGYYLPSKEEGLFGEYVPGKYLTIDHMIDIRMDLLVLPDDTTRAYGSDYNISYPLGDEGVFKSPWGKDLKRILQVAVDAARSARTAEFTRSAARAHAMEAHFTAAKKIQAAQISLKRAMKEMEQALEVGRSLGLEESMMAQAREIDKRTDSY